MSASPLPSDHDAPLVNPGEVADADAAVTRAYADFDAVLDQAGAYLPPALRTALDDATTAIVASLRDAVASRLLAVVADVLDLRCAAPQLHVLTPATAPRWSDAPAGVAPFRGSCARRRRA